MSSSNNGRATLIESVRTLASRVLSRARRTITHRNNEQFQQAVLAAARSIAARGDHRVVLPVTNGQVAKPASIRIGLFDNLANQAYVTARALRRLGFEVDVIVQDNFIDRYALANPAWEECEFEALDPWQPLNPPSGWQREPFVRSVAYDENLQTRFAGRISAIEEVNSLYQQAFGSKLPRDLALLLAQHMGQWNYIKAMYDYDIVVLSMAAIMLGPFSPKPTVVCPLGGDLYICPFEENVSGLLFRAGYMGASHVIVCETDYGAYLDRLGITADRTFLPLLVDTDVYHDRPEPGLRHEWQRAVGGDVFLFGTCRQSWQWKGTNRLIEGFALFRQQNPQAENWRLVLQAWGDDLERSRDLVRTLGLSDVTVWQSMCSKPLLRQRQRAADVTCDQFVMEGYGSSVLESMAAGKPMIISPVPEGAKHHFRTEAPPFVGARTAMEIATAIGTLTDPEERKRVGRLSREWVEREHGYRTLGPIYVDMLKKALEAWGAGLPPNVSITSQLRQAHHERRVDIKTRWDRVLPLGEAFGDRWEKAQFLGFGDGASIYDSAIVIGDITVGEKTWIGPNCVLDGSGGLKIGATCSISAGVQIYSHDTVNWAVSGGKAAYNYSATEIGDHVYLGPNVVVSAGCRIGRCTIVGAQSFVNSDIPPNSFAIGTPARVIGRVENDGDGRIVIIREAPSGSCNRDCDLPD